MIEANSVQAPHFDKQIADDQFPKDPFQTTLADIIQPEPAKTEGFAVDTIDKANWVSAKIGEAQDRINMLYDKAAEYKEKIDRWVEDAVKADQNTINFFMPLMKDWLERELFKQKGKAKSIKLIDGKVGMRKGTDKVNVKDEAAAIADLKITHPDLVKSKTEESIDKKAAKELLLKGELIDGMEIERATETFYLETAQGAKVSFKPDVSRVPSLPDAEAEEFLNQI